MRPFVNAGIRNLQVHMIALDEKIICRVERDIVLLFIVRKSIPRFWLHVWLRYLPQVNKKLYRIRAIHAAFCYIRALGFHKVHILQ